MAKRWTEREDKFLLFYGPAVGYDRVASHDLHREPGTGSRRAAWLKKHRPLLVAQLEREHAEGDKAIDELCRTGKMPNRQRQKAPAEVINLKR